jgi:hypothetical protein
VKWGRERVSERQSARERESEREHTRERERERIEGKEREIGERECVMTRKRVCDDEHFHRLPAE